MNHRTIYWLGLLASLMITPMGWAQVPAVPAAAGAAPAAPAAPGNLWSFLMPNADQKAACKTCYCNSPLGQLTSGASGPFSLMSGGLVKNRCLQNSILNDLKKPADAPEGLAARVKADEEDAKARRAAVRFLGTVDCNYWPEAIDALKTGLRKDRNECVRFEAALALRNGCCCNKEIIKALEICITSSDADGFPKERSDRVRAAATDALMRCPLMLEEGKKEGMQKVDAGPVDPTDFYKSVGLMSHNKVVASARAVLTSMQDAKKDPAANAGTTPPASGVAPPPAIHQRPGSLSGIVTHAFSPEGSRQPFFAGLTKTLTGKQDGTMPARQETGTPIAPGIVKIRETNTVTPIDVVPVPGTKIVMPVDIVPMPGTESTPMRAREIKATVPFEIVPPAPPVPSDPFLGRPRETKPAVPVEIIQPAPSGESSSTGPRETHGIITIETRPPSPVITLPEPVTPTTRP
jgi:hypothetical protein